MLTSVNTWQYPLTVFLTVLDIILCGVRTFGQLLNLITQFYAGHLALNIAKRLHQHYMG